MLLALIPRIVAMLADDNDAVDRQVLAAEGQRFFERGVLSQAVPRNALARLSDRELDDIGLCRGDIATIVSAMR